MAHSFYVEVAQGSVFVKIFQPRDISGSPIILFHDSLGCVEMWRNFPQVLADFTGREVIAYDRLGYGQSSSVLQPASKSFISMEYEKTLKPLLEHMNLKTVVFFGHSVGGALALDAASKLPGIVEAVITESAQAFVEERTIRGIEEAVAVRTMFIEKLGKYHGSQAHWVFSSWVDTWLSEEFSSWVLRYQLDCPILAIHGLEDEYGSERHAGRICELTSGRNQKVILDGSKHFPHRDNPKKIARLVKDFL